MIYNSRSLNTYVQRQQPLHYSTCSELVLAGYINCQKKLIQSLETLNIVAMPSCHILHRFIRQNIVRQEKINLKIKHNFYKSECKKTTIDSAVELL